MSGFFDTTDLKFILQSLHSKYSVKSSSIIICMSGPFKYILQVVSDLASLCNPSQRPTCLQRFAPQAGEMPVLRCQQITDKAATPRSMDVAQTTIPAAWDPSQLPSQTSEQVVASLHPTHHPTTAARPVLLLPWVQSVFRNATLGCFLQ